MSTDNTTHHLVRGRCSYCRETGVSTKKACASAPGAQPALRELRCKGCRRRVGFTTRTQPVPVQCLDPWCALEPPARQNEERDSFIEYLVDVAGQTPERVGQLFSLSRQGVSRVLVNR